MERTYETYIIYTNQYDRLKNNLLFFYLPIKMESDHT
jgi:hypothetical protein